MIILDTTTKSLELVLGGSITTNQLPYVVSYADITTTAFTAGEADGTSNNTSTVTIVSAPASSTQRQVKYISVYNADTVAATVTIRLDNNGTTRTLAKVTLNTLDLLIYNDSEGWRVYDSSGQQKITNAGISSVLLDQTGLVVKGGDSNALTIKPNETLTGARTLNLITGDASRTVTLTGSPSLSGITATGTGTLALGTKNLTLSNTLTLAGTDSTTMTFPSTSATIARTDAANSFTGTQTHAGPVYSTNGIFGANSTSAAPIVLYVKNVTVLTSGSPADVATITVPAGITRYALLGTTGTNRLPAGIVVDETQSGTLAAATFQCFSASGGGGSQVTAVSTSGPTAVGEIQAIPGNTFGGGTSVQTGSTIYIRQAANSANAGTVSFYITIWPLP